jgi:hypothetical protein
VSKRIEDLAEEIGNRLGFDQSFAETLLLEQVEALVADEGSLIEVFGEAQVAVLKLSGRYADQLRASMIEQHGDTA